MMDDFSVTPMRYQPRARLAVGGMAEVWSADAIFFDGSTRPVAVKRVLPHLADQPLYRSMFEDEARLGRLLQHPNVVRVFDARDVAGTFLIVMELVEGPSLKALLEDAQRRGRTMPVATALYLFRELARALAYAHSAVSPTGVPLGIVHRDVSPHNILLGKDGAVKLTDFGLANAKIHETANEEALIGGKLGYLAPEVIQQVAVDARLDFFAAGIVLWELLTGQRLFQGRDDQDTVQQVLHKPIPPASAINPRVPTTVDLVLGKLLARDRNNRFADAGPLVAALDRLIAQVDPNVGPHDVSLLVGLHAGREHFASVNEATAAAPSFDDVARELDAFVRLEFESPTNSGAEPLDPSAFGKLFSGRGALGRGGGSGS